MDLYVLFCWSYSGLIVSFQDKNVESSENVELTYVSPKPCRDAPQVCIVKFSTSGFTVNNDNSTRHNFIFISQTITFQAEPDQKWEDKACISDSSTKKIEDLSNFKALDTQEASEQVDHRSFVTYSLILHIYYAHVLRLMMCWKVQILF